MATTLQIDMITRIAESEFTEVNGSTPKSVDDIGWVWADMIIETSQDKGAFTSLVNAGLAKHTGSGKDAAVTLTTAGFEEYQRAKEA